VLIVGNPREWEGGVRNEKSAVHGTLSSKRDDNVRSGRSPALSGRGAGAPSGRARTHLGGNLLARCAAKHPEIVIRLEV